MKTRDIWESKEWDARRRASLKFAREYEGEHLGETEPRRDDKGNLIKKFPMGLNISSLVCDVHMNYARGEVRDDELFVKSLVVRGENSEQAELAEDVINNKIWRPSFGGFILQQALLDMNIYGGTVFKISSEPWDMDLPLGLAVRHIPDPSFIKPEFDFLNRWRMLSCYFGYEISAEMAVRKYGVEPKDSNRTPLYMEYWTKDTWRITVDDVVPVMEGFGPLEGENTWGFVPFYYVPHEVGTQNWGRSQLGGLDFLGKEINSRTVGVSDMVRSFRHDVVWATDIRGDPYIRTVRPEGQAPIHILDIGKSSGSVGSKPPQLHSMPSPDIPEGMAKWPENLLSLFMQFGRISPATFGKDDTSSGRITGPAVAQRMWTSTSHATTERMNLTTAKCLMDADMIRILCTESFKEDLRARGIECPDIDSNIRHIIMQSWPTYLPLDREARHRELIERLRDGGISIESYLEEMGHLDVDQEKDKIFSWKKAVSKLRQVFGGGNNGNRDQSEAAQDGPGEREPGNRGRIPEKELG